MKRDSFPGWVLVVLPGVALVAAALVPVFRGRPMNVTFFALAILWFILGLAIAKGQKKPQSPGNSPK